MRNLKITLEYDGTDYCGWQIQNSGVRGRGSGVRTIQEVIQNTLRKILQEKIKLIGSGRTDAGVHALAQVANFKTTKEIPLKKLKRSLNSLLPDDIVVTKVEEVSASFHSRFDAKSKLYRYTILNRGYPSAHWHSRSYFCPYPLELVLMKKEARCLLGKHNFGAFQASDKKEKSAVRTIKKLRIVKEGGFIHIDIEADGFLYNMARNIVGTLVDIGRGRFKKGALEKILRSRDRKLAGPTAPAAGLCLMRVTY